MIFFTVKLCVRVFFSPCLGPRVTWCQFRPLIGRERSREFFDDVFMLMSHVTTFSLSDWLRATFAALWLVTDWSSHVYYWYAFLYLTLESLFPAASLANLSLISLERLHATIYPFRHCLIREQIYFTLITFSWLLALFFASMVAILVVLRAQLTLDFYVFASYCFIAVLIILLCDYYFECQKQPSITYFWIKAFSREETINNFICNDCGVLPDHSTFGCLGSYVETHGVTWALW